MFHVINECLTLVIVLSAGIYSGRYMTSFYKIFFTQVVVWICFYIASYIVTGIQESNHETVNDQWLINIHVPLETFFLMLAAYLYFPTTLTKTLIMMLFSCFMIFYFFRVHVMGINNFDGYVIVAQSISITTIYMQIMYRHFSTTGENGNKSPVIWVCSGLLIYFACCVPYFSLFNYLNDNYPKLSTLLYYIITGPLATIRYLCLARAFWLLRKDTRISVRS
ncbi:MAG: hypothetical protein ACJ77K_06680 [Bacteroidia bacterium]